MTSNSKIDHALRKIVRVTHGLPTEKDGKGSRATHERPELVEDFFSTHELARHVAREGKLDVLVRTNDAVRAAKHIEHLGGEAKCSVHTPVLAARIPYDKILEVAADPSVVLMELASEYRPSLDRANLSSSLANDAGERYFPAELGQGVLIGIIDSGIDVLHPAFAEVDKPTRIVAYWDQTNNEKYGDGFKPIVDAAKGSPDTDGHGTAVASCAAGNGRGSPDGAMVGVAPQAKIAAVKTTMTNVDLVHAINWLCERALQLELPLVINMSLGGHADGHDGYDMLSQHIDSISDKGRIVVVAAGNEGSDDIHAMHEFDADAPVWGFEFQPWLKPAATDANLREGKITVTVWGNRHDDIELLLEDPRGYAHAAPSGIGGHTDLDSPGYTGDFHKDRQLVTDDVFHVITLKIASEDKLLRGPWTVHAKLRGATTRKSVLVHAWVTSDRQGAITRGASREYLVGSPGAARSAITAGACTSRNEWVTATAKIFKADGLRLDQIAGFSSRGPTRDNRLKPELAAPGEYVGMAHSSRAKAEPLYQMGQSAYAVMRGTSFASPYIAGAVALLLQIEPTLTPDEAKLLLMGTATERRPGIAWGAGKLDCKRMLQEATKLLRPAKRVTSGA